jgi:hypothetical protein
MSGAIPPLLQFASMAWCSVKSQRRLYLYLLIDPILSETNSITPFRLYSSMCSHSVCNLKVFRPKYMFPHFFHAYYTHRPPHSSWFNYCNDISDLLNFNLNLKTLFFLIFNGQLHAAEPSLEDDSCLAAQVPHVMESAGSLPLSQWPAAGLCPESLESSPQTLNVFL